jgi:hypothetical protein
MSVLMYRKNEGNAAAYDKMKQQNATFLDIGQYNLTASYQTTS